LLPPHYRYFDRLPSGEAGKHLVGDEFTYADLMLWHVCEGLQFAYPNAMARLLPKYPAIRRVTDE
jgi:glutathione S-transferase